MGNARHWKQHWDPTAPLIFIRRMRLGIKGHEVVKPGDEVTPEIRAAIGAHPAKQNSRLRRWWEAKFLAIKDWKAPSEIARARREKPVPTFELLDVGKGWYYVYGAAGAEPLKVRGRAKADEALEQLKTAAAAASNA